MLNKFKKWYNTPNYRTPPLTNGQSYHYFITWTGLGFLFGVATCVNLALILVNKEN